MSKRKKTKKKVVKKSLTKTWEDGNNPIGLNLNSPMSYEKYLKHGLETLSKHFSIRTYKLAPKDEYPQFIRGKDLRVQIYWKKESKYEFLIEQTFYYQSNRNKEDRKYMRQFANIHLKSAHDAWLKAKALHEKNEKKTKKVTKTGKVTKKWEDANSATQENMESRLKKEANK
tara:strand:- start:1766 stop:2281 length:516 start_codon:yes stop_codon:yes gene_type:complete